MKKHDPIAEYCRDWVRWTQTRRFYFNPPTQGLLARLTPSKGGEPPDARNLPGMQYFNMAIHMMADLPQWRNEAKTFAAHYAGAGEVVKVAAAKLGIAPRTYYDHLKRFADAAYSLAHSIQQNQGLMTPATAVERAAVAD